MFSIVDDSVRDLSPAAHEYVVVGQDGGIWLGSHAGDLAKLGATTTLDWQLIPDEYLMDFEVASDRMVWAVRSMGAGQDWDLALRRRRVGPQRLRYRLP